jgi:predicted CoA-binding protein
MASAIDETLEIEFDRLLYRVTRTAELPEVEDLLRRARRMVILASVETKPTIAIVGASTNRAKYGNKAVRAFVRAGFEVYPINPNASYIEGLPAYASLDDLPVDRLDRVSFYVPPHIALRVLDQVARKSVGEVWLNPGADSPAVVDRARSLGVEVVQACSILAVGEHPDRV